MCGCSRVLSVSNIKMSWFNKALPSLYLVFLCYLTAHCAVNKASTEASFNECLVSKPAGSLAYCIGYGALSKLQSYDNNPEFDLVDGVTYTRDEKMFREGYSVLDDSNPSDFRTVMDSVGQVLSRRSMRWDMGFVYPGLAMKVSPSASSVGVLEFVMDPHREAGFSQPQHALKEASTGRILARQFLVPFLLGFKFNIATLLPIIFGIIAIMAKKAVFLSKIALIISSAFSLGTLLLGSNVHGGYGGNGGNGGYGYQPPYNPGFGGGGHHHYNRYPTEDDYQESFRAESANANAYNTDDQLRIYDSDLQLQQAFSREDDKKGRNFAWNDAEKVVKT